MQTWATLQQSLVGSTLVSVPLSRQHISLAWMRRPQSLRWDGMPVLPTESVRQTSPTYTRDAVHDGAGASVSAESVYGEGSAVEEAFEDLQFQVRTDAGWEIDEDEDGKSQETWRGGT